MGLLGEAPPRTVEVAGREAAVNCDWRTGVRVEALDTTDPRCVVKALRLMYCDGRGLLPEPVAQDPLAAWEAAVAWHNGGWRCVEYGRRRREARQARRLIDFEADAAIIECDFRRLYGVDLGESRMHWYRFCRMVTSAALTGGSLLNQAFAARLTSLAGLKGEQRKRAQALREAWALPPTEAEALARAKAEFARG